MAPLLTLFLPSRRPMLPPRSCGCVLVADADLSLAGIFTDGDLRRTLQQVGCSGTLPRLLLCTAASCYARELHAGTGCACRCSCSPAARQHGSGQQTPWAPLPQLSSVPKLLPCSALQCGADGRDIIH
jgi:hypothetical protein